MQILNLTVEVVRRTDEGTGLRLSYQNYQAAPAPTQAKLAPSGQSSSIPPSRRRCVWTKGWRCPECRESCSSSTNHSPKSSKTPRSASSCFFLLGSGAGHAFFSAGSVFWGVLFTFSPFPWSFELLGGLPEVFPFLQELFEEYFSGSESVNGARDSEMGVQEPPEARFTDGEVGVQLGSALSTHLTSCDSA